MTPISKPRLAALNLTALLICALIGLVWWLGFGRVPTVTPATARAMLSDGRTNAVLVDVRPASTFAATHLPGAANWSWEQIRAAKGLEEMPDELRKRRLLLICDTGITSAMAVRKLKTMGVADAWSVQGGLLNWTLVVPDTARTESRPVTAAASSIFSPMESLRMTGWFNGPVT